MNRETLIAELDRLLGAGEPLLDVFPKEHPDKWWLQLPDNTSDSMVWYADEVAWRADDRNQYQNCRQQDSPNYLAGLVRELESGLLGWRAIGVLR